MSKKQKEQEKKKKKEKKKQKQFQREQRKKEQRMEELRQRMEEIMSVWSNAQRNTQENMRINTQESRQENVQERIQIQRDIRRNIDIQRQPIQQQRNTVKTGQGPKTRDIPEGIDDSSKVPSSVSDLGNEWGSYEYREDKKDEIEQDTEEKYAFRNKEEERRKRSAGSQIQQY